jgi:hypothetical protein
VFYAAGSALLPQQSTHIGHDVKATGQGWIRLGIGMVGQCNRGAVRVGGRWRDSRVETREGSAWFAVE